MCGLVGVMGKTIQESVKKTFFDLLHLDVLRGDDSTGVAAISNIDSDKMEVEVFKSLGSPSDFFWEHCPNKKHKSLTFKPVNIYMGHNRYATQGKVISDNAHPFEFENLVGAHNGTLLMSSLRDFHNAKDFDVDSQIIYSHLSHTRDIKSVWRDADGAMALSWFDKVDRKLNLIRNKERPLFFAYSKDDKNLLWASEEWMLYVASGRQDVDILQPVRMEPNRLYTFSLTEEGKISHIEEDLPPFVAKPIPLNYYGGYGKNSEGFNNYWDEYEDYYKHRNGQSTNHKSGKSHKNTSDKKESNSSIFVITEFVDNPRQPHAFGYLPSGKLIRVNIPINKYTEAKTKLLGPQERQIFFNTTKYYKNVNDSNSFWCPWDSCKLIQLKPHLRIVRREDNSFVFKEKEAVKLEYAKSFNENIFLTLSSFAEKTKCGCVNCLKVPVWAERDTIQWIADDTFTCKDCVSLPLVRELINA